MLNWYNKAVSALKAISNINTPAQKYATDDAMYTALSFINKAVYTASSVACFWAGAVTRPYTLQQVLAVSLLIASSAEKALLY